MTDTILVPGTQATILEDQNGNTVYNAVRATLGLSKFDLAGRTVEEVRKLLSMQHQPGVLEPQKTSLLEGTTIELGDVLQAPYDGLPWGEAFLYDWRADIRYNALRLMDHLRENPQPGNKRWNLVGHSQGGLVIVLASKMGASHDEFARLVGRVALVGTPLSGTMRAAEAMLFGRDDLGKDMLPAVQRAARTWPAMYQMLPAWDAVVTRQGTPLDHDRQLLARAGWPNVQGIQDDLLLRGRETHALLAGPFSHMGPSVLKLVVQGDQQTTPLRFVRHGDQISDKCQNQRGDSLVPHRMTFDRIGPQQPTEARVGVRGARAHAFLCEDEEVISYVKEFLASPMPAPPA